MKRTLIIGGLAALTLTAGGVAVAQQVPQDPPRHARGDKDGDGRVSKAEFVDGRLARLTALDADRDGTVSAAEMQAGREARRAAGADRAFGRMDANGDGAVTRAEFDASRAGRGERRAERGERRGGRGMHRGGGRRGGMERGPVVIADARTRAEQGFARLDANGDGYVSAEERQAQRAERRERRSRPAPASE
ncbi:MAG TPA: EF-hand domain-containing protein [Brevundimonas sp.]|jgi:hypothetical protein|uniref:EF-hand domain-containing protein n=1 Tax=Brevundimonas sp. TaxID=1871086 RepID=UPI002DE4868C|nr:EF-hand domain-containing protein [Brevundimonas sp.]